MPTRKAARAAPRRSKTRKVAKARPRKSPNRPPSKLQRRQNPMPSFVRAALQQHGLLGAYRARPAYQQNDYLGWISAAKREDTSRKRLEQMLDELDRGDLYMKMSWSSKRLAKQTS